MNSQTVLFFSTVNQAKVRNGGTSTRNMKRKNMTLQMISLLLYNVSKGKISILQMNKGSNQSTVESS
jgi:hypothetical protein